MRKLHVEIYLPPRPGEELLIDALNKTAALSLLGMDPQLLARNYSQNKRLRNLCDEHDFSWLKEYITVSGAE